MSVENGRNQPMHNPGDLRVPEGVVVKPLAKVVIHHSDEPDDQMPEGTEHQHDGTTGVLDKAGVFHYRFRPVSQEDEAEGFG